MPPVLTRRASLRIACVVIGATLVLDAAPRPATLDHATAVHVASRLSFGATPALVRQVEGHGLAAFLDTQLGPAAPDPVVEARLARLQTLAMSPRALAETYYIPAQERRRADQTPSTVGPAVPARPSGDPRPDGMAMPADGAPGPERTVIVELVTQKLVRTTAAERQLEEVLVDFWVNHLAARPTTAIPRPGADQGALDLDGHFGLHPRLAPLHALYRNGSLAVVHACGSPDPTRSHFDAQDYMETGTPGVKRTQDGWLNRLVAQRHDAEHAGAMRAVAMSPQLPRILQGRAPTLAMTPRGDGHFRSAASGGGCSCSPMPALPTSRSRSSRAVGRNAVKFS